VTLVERGRSCFFPTGSTTLHSGDLIQIIAAKENMNKIFRFAGKTETPLRRIGIVGGGPLGALVAEQLLSDRPHIPFTSRRITIIEQDYSICKELAARFPNALILNENISDESFIAEERIGNFDLIITATGNQELNIIAAVYLKSRGVSRAISLVSSPGYKNIAIQLGVDAAIPINSVVVDAILSHITGMGIRDIHSLGDGSFGIVEVEIGNDSPAAEKLISEFKNSCGGFVMLVNREKTSFIPNGGYVFKPSDKILLITSGGREREIKRFFGLTKKGK
jgi:trk system potassium uptake protein TrkA